MCTCVYVFYMNDCINACKTYWMHECNHISIRPYLCTQAFIIYYRTYIIFTAFSYVFNIRDQLCTCKNYILVSLCVIRQYIYRQCTRIRHTPVEKQDYPRSLKALTKEPSRGRQTELLF
jgi:hypothetical protein